MPHGTMATMGSSAAASWLVGEAWADAGKQLGVEGQALSI